MGSKNQRFFAMAAAVSLTSFLGLAPAAHAEWKIEGPDGSSIKFGFLAQMRAEAIDSDAAGADTTTDLFFRRLRLLAGGKINDQWSFFFETDSPNLGKGESDGSKNSGDIFIQDFIVTYKPRSDAFMLDFGQLLGEITYNSNTSAVALLGTDYGPHSFVWAGALDTKVGRDYGVRARGYLFEDRLEYRASVLEGQRGSDSENDLRFLGRLMYNFFDPMKGYFYNGTSLGTKHYLSIGASYDTQEDYDTVSLDAHWDQPLAGGNSVTVSASWSSIDGDDFLTSLPDQDNTFIEAGYYHAGSKLMPFLQYSDRDFDASGASDQEITQIGLGYMFRGHNGNVKFSWATVDNDGGDDEDQIWLNMQVFAF